MIDEGYQIALERIDKVKQNGSELLDLSQLQLKEIPAKIRDVSGQISQLFLNNNIIDDISILSSFKRLHRLDLSNNKIKNIRTLSDLERLEYLDMSNNDIENINSLSGLKLLFGLQLTENRIQDISPLSPLVNLTSLRLGRNNIIDISSLSEMKNLNIVELYDNGIYDIEALSSLKGLQIVSLQNNNIDNIARNIFENLEVNYVFEPTRAVLQGMNLSGNPLVSPPVEILLAGRKAILDYFDTLGRHGRDHLYEAKLIVVGEPGSGKTTFCAKMGNLNAPLPNDTTKGIVISPLKFQNDEKKVMQLNIWDFGGQEIYHQTHQFFLTQRSLYVLLTDNRRQDTDFNWWLDTIKALGNNSPIIIVQNERDDRMVDLDIKEITEMFPAVKRFVTVNFATNRGVAELRELIGQYAFKLDHIGEELPKSWINIRKKIEETGRKNNYISIDGYLQLCAPYITSVDEARRLCRVYHYLGALLNFEDNPVLKNTVILRNEWATDAVYKILDNRPITDSRGRFTKKDCEKIWVDPQYKNKHDELLELMLKFDLCYRMHDTNQYILPQLLPAQKPDYDWDNKSNIQVNYVYEGYMPKGIVNRLMARLNWYVDLNRSWKTGAVLFKQGATAEIRETFGKREITVRIGGINKKQLLLFIDEELNRIHRGYSQISVKKHIGCICVMCVDNPSKMFYDYDALIDRLKKKNIIECSKSYLDVRVEEIIKSVSLEWIRPDIARQDEMIAKRKKIFICYSKSDKEYKDRLITYLQQFERNGFIEQWCDSELKAGEEWDERIKAELDQAHIILLLCSQDMLATQYVQEVEITRAFERKERGETVIVPVIIRPCTYTYDSRLKILNAIPGKGKPVTDSAWGNIDNAYMEIYRELKEIIEQ